MKKKIFAMLIAVATVGAALSAGAITLRLWSELQQRLNAGGTVTLTKSYTAIYGVLYLYGADNLADGFGTSPIEEWSIDFGPDDPSFDTAPDSGLVTQTATATLSYTSYKFFKATIGVMIPEEPPDDPPEEPWDPDVP